jgi:hypothetical protein
LTSERCWQARRGISTPVDGVASYLRDHVRQLALLRVASTQPLVRVLLTPNHRVSVTWFVVCSKGLRPGLEVGQLQGAHYRQTQGRQAHTQPG